MNKNTEEKTLKKMRGTTATYIHEDGSSQCDVVELAKLYSKMGNIPERVGWSKAEEICLMARGFSILWEEREEKRRANE